jgi:hypothetical protein
MAGIFSYKCSSCEEIHEGSPNFAFQFPDQYASLSEQERSAKNVHVESDFCNVDENYFIRVCLDIPIVGVEDPFTWGVWVSLKKENFFKYWASFNEPQISERYFGWFCNSLPFYPKTLSLKTMVTTHFDGSRPTIELEEDSDHPLAIDYRSGISIARAQEIAEIAMHGKR